MKGFHTSIDSALDNNSNFRQVLYTARNTQLVIMNILPSDEIGQEVHDVDQFFRFESGQGRVVIDAEEYLVKAGDVVVVPAGSQHNVNNTSNSEPLKLYTLYCPPHHKDKTIHATKEVAQEDKEHFDGETTE